jgi:nondiscriminating glutamyl-tRNA synthetase
MSEVRVRFAPSPTGYVHVGNARTALFNWLFARHHGGTFILRIEDTDIERSRAEYERRLLEDLRWFGLDWDEGPDEGGPFGPYRQSERLELYRRHAMELIDAGHAYFCFCSAEQLEAERQEALKAGRQPMYSGHCRTRPREEAARKVAAGEPAAMRLQVAPGTFNWNDLVHGPTNFSSEVIGDFILVRSDGHPAYNYAVVIDDHLMAITHVIRGDDHISNTPRQLALYQALGWEPPQFAHLSTILGPDRARLSKRHGATSLQNFRDMGILPEALRNYLALLGWSAADGVTEILSDQELIRRFSLERITRSPAVFDAEKLNWMNRHYMKESSSRRLAELSVPFLAQAGYLTQPADEHTLAWLERVLEAVIKNISQLSELPGAVQLIFEYDAKRVISGQETRHVVEDRGPREVLIRFIENFRDFQTRPWYARVQASAGTGGHPSSAALRYVAKTVQKETGRKGKDLFHPIRVALTGAVSGPELEKLIPIFEEGSKLPLARHVKSVSERLREFADEARLN